MQKWVTKIMAAVMTMMMLVGMVAPASAAQTDPVLSKIEKVASWLLVRQLIMRHTSSTRPLMVKIRLSGLIFRLPMKSPSVWA